MTSEEEVRQKLACACCLEVPQESEKVRDPPRKRNQSHHPKLRN
eukprot:COSAG06_NODE_20142_length_806_cov_3.732673_2_plen_43_part_01